MKKIIISLVFIWGFVLNTNAQYIENIVASGREDASIYLGNYLKPIYKGLITNLNSGWYHSGKTHKVLGFDITINTTASLVPTANKTFTFRNADYSLLELQSGNISEELPTIMGPTSTSRIIVKNRDANGIIIPNEFLPSFETLDGIGNDLPVNAVPSPMIQVGLGLPSKTDVKIRFVPNVGNKDVQFNLIGVGLQHNLLQYFDRLEKLPLFDLSILGAYTTSTTIYSPADSSIGTNQETTIKINAYTAQVIGNLNLKIVNFYAGLGYTSGNASTTVKGNYSYDVTNTAGIPTGATVSLIDPIDIKYTMKKGVKATLGTRINVAWFKIFADYSIQEYNTINAGIAFSFR